MALLHYTAPPVLGGVESILAAHARLLSGAGYQVRVVAGRGDCDLLPELDSRHPEVEAVTRRLAAGDPPGAAADQLQERIGEGLRRLLDGADLVIAHNVMTMHFNLPLTAALAALHRPILAWTHDLSWANPRYQAFQRPGEAFAVLHRPVPGVRYTAISARVRAHLAEVYEVTAEVVPNGIDRAALLRIRPSTMRFLEAAGALGPGPMVLVPFRVTRRKRLELAIRAVAALGGRRRGLRLVVSGPLGPHSVDNDDYWDELVELRRSLGMEGTVVFLREHGQPHPVDDQMVAELYQLASAVLLTSESEGFGLPVLEAGIARVPVICSDLEVFREVVDDEAYRFAVDATPEEVAERLEEGLDSNVARLLVRIGDRYDWGSVLPRIEEEIRLAVA